MNASLEHGLSVLGRHAEVAAAGPLGADAEADLVVVGAGLAGLPIACELAREGRSVIVLDRGPIGGMTARTTGHLSSDLDD